MQSLPPKSRYGLPYQEKHNIAGKVFKDEFNAFSVEGQLRFLPKFIEGSYLQSLSDLINIFKALTGSSRANLATQ